MISYDNYKNRIEKLAKAKRAIHKFRFLIIGIAAALLAVAVGLMCAKGTYTSAMSMSYRGQTLEGERYEIYYSGNADDYDFTPASAFLSSSEIKYTKEGSDEWIEKPVRVGTYRAYSVSQKLVGFNEKRSIEFEIKQKDVQINITSNSMTYGDESTVNVEAQGLVSGHKLVKAGLEFDYEDVEATVTDVSVKKNTVKIVDASGEDYSDCYNPVPNAKKLTINQRKLTVTPEDCKHTYSGEEISFNSLADAQTVASLASGDTIVLTAYVNGNKEAKAINAGEYPIKVDGETVRIMHDGVYDVTSHYNLSYKPATLTVEKRDITVSTKSNSKVYDGTALACLEYDGVENLVAGHEVSVLSGENLTNAGTVENRLVCAVADGDGTDVTRNYNIIYNLGELTVNKRTVMLSTDSDEKLYDGTALKCLTFSNVENLVSGHSIQAYDGSAIINAGKAENRLQFVVYDSANGDVTQNYNISENCGTLTVNKRTLTITNGGAEKVFDGEKLTCSIPANLSGDGLALGQSLAVDEEFSVTNVTAAAGVKNSTTFKVVSGGEDVSQNYNISYDTEHGGILKVTVRYIVVITDTASADYSGKPFYSTGATTKWADDRTQPGLVGTADKLAVRAGYATVTTVSEGSVTNECAYDVPNSNYEISGYEYGSISIRPRPIVVVTNGATKVYDAQPISNAEYTTYYQPNPEEAGLVGGDTLTLVGSAIQFTDVGEHPNTNVYTASNNYSLTFRSGIIKITVRNIIVQTGNAEKEYDGGPLSKTDGYQTFWQDDITKAGLLNGELLEVDDYTVIPSNVTGDTPYENRCTYKDPANYHIVSYINGTLSITPRHVRVTTADDGKVYDGTGLYNATYSNAAVKHLTQNAGGEYVEDGEVGIIGSDVLAVNSYTTITNVTDANNGEAGNNICEFENSNYFIHYVYGTLTVSKRPITVVTSSVSRTYNGEALTYDRYDEYYYDNPGETGLIGDDTLTLIGTAVSCVNVGTYPNDNRYDAGDNYEIKRRVVGTLEITEREIIIIIPDKSFVYDGEEHTFTEYTTEFAENRTQSGLLGNDKLTNLTSTSVTDVCAPITNVCTYKLPEFEAGKSNYKINVLAGYEYGTIEITKRPIKITTGTDSKVYDGLPLTAVDYSSVVYGGEWGGTRPAALASGHRLVVDEVFSITDVAENVDNRTTYKVFAGSVDKSGNYDVSYVYGKLTITAKHVNICVNGWTADYGDGYDYLAHYSGVSNYDLAKSQQLANDEKLEITQVKYYEDVNFIREVTPKYVGSYYVKASADGCAVYDKNGSPISNNYVFGWLTENKLEIKPLAITHTISNTQSVTYGDNITDSEYLTNGGAALPYGDQIEISYEFYLTGETSPSTLTGADKSVRVGTYKIVGKYAENNNYSLTINDGKLTVLKKRIIVEVNDKSFSYGKRNYIVSQTTDFIVYDYSSGAEIEILPYNEKMKISIEYYLGGTLITDLQNVKNVGDYVVKYSSYEITETHGGTTVAEYLGYEVVSDNEGIYEITAKDLSVKAENKTCSYGDELPQNSFKADGLEYGEEITVSFAYSPTPVHDKGDYAIIPSNAQVIGSATGINNYNVTYEDGVLSIEAKKVTISLPKDDNKLKYGTVPDGYGWYGLGAYGEELRVTYAYTSGATDFTGTNIPVGNYTVTYSDYAVYQSDKTMLISGGVNNYEITITDGGLEVEYLSIAISINDLASVTYGSGLVYPATVGNYTLTGSQNLVYGETLKIAVKFKKDGEESAEAINAGTYEIIPDLANSVVYDGHGNPITNGLKNYSLGWNSGWTNASGTIDKFVVDYKITDSISVTYGTAPDEYEMRTTYGGNPLPYGESLKIVYEFRDGANNLVTPHNASTYKIQAQSVSVYSGGTLIDAEANNYDITIRSGTLTVNKKILNIKIQDIALSYGEGNCTSYVFVNYAAASAVYDIDLGYANESLKVEAKAYAENSGVFSEAVLKNVGTYKLEAWRYVLTVGTDKEEVSATEELTNYIINCSYGTCIISPVQLTIKVDDKECTYGDTLPENSFKVEGLKYTETLTVEYEYDRTPYNAGYYDITAVNLKIDGSASGLSNYSPIVNDGGRLHIKQFIIEYKIPDDLTVEYGGALPTGITITEYEGSPLPNGDSVYISYVIIKDGTPINTAERQSAGKNYVVEGTTADYVNYNISVQSGKLEITKKNISVAMTRVSDVTYGSTFSYAESVNNYTLLSGSLADGETLQIAVKFTQDGSPAINAGKYTQMLDKENCTVKYGGTEIIGGINNYEVDCASIEDVEIFKKEIEVTVADKSCDFGDDLPENSSTITSGLDALGNLPYGDVLTVTYKYDSTPYAKGTYTIQIDKKFINGEEVGVQNFNYDVTTVDGTLTISALELEFSLPEESAVYGETPASSRGVTGCDLVNGDYLTVYYMYMQNGEEILPVRVGDFDVVCYNYEVTNTNGTADVNNYLITIWNGALTVTERPFKVTFTDGLSATYTGGEIDYTAITNAIKVDGILEGDEISLTLSYASVSSLALGASGMPVHADEYEISLNSVQFISGDASCYRFDETNSATDVTFTVLAKHMAVTISAPDKTVYYGDDITTVPPSMVTYEVDGAVNGEILDLTFEYDFSSVTNPNRPGWGYYDILVSAASISNGNRRIENYDIEYSDAVLTIHKKTVQITIDKTTEATYGQSYSVGYDNMLAYNEVLVLALTYNGSEEAPVNAGTYSVWANLIDSTVDGGNEDISNYIINLTENSPQLIINKAHIEEVVLNALNAVTRSSFEYGDETYDADIKNASATGLIPGESLVVALQYYKNDGAVFSAREGTPQPIAAPKHTGNYVAVIDWDNCSITDGVNTLANNYLLDKCDPFGFSIYALDVYVTVENHQSKEYGEAKPVMYSVAPAMPYGESLSLTFEFESKTSGNVITGGLNADTYIIKVKSSSITGTDASDDDYNFIFVNSAPEFEVSPLNIDLVLNDVTAVYGGTVAYDDEIDNFKTKLNLPNKERLKVEVEYLQNGAVIATPSEAGEYDIRVKSFTVYSEGGSLISGGEVNYVVEGSGTLTITAMAVRVRTASDEKVYDGTPLTAHRWTITEGELPTGYTLVCDDFGYTNATPEGGVKNKITLTVKYNGESSENLKVAYDYGNLVITKRPITITSLSDSKEYDGTSLTAGYTTAYTGDTSKPAMGTGDVFNFIGSTAIDNVGSEDNEIAYTIKNAENLNVAANYAITEVWGTLTITKKAITVTPDDVTAQYGVSFSVNFSGALVTGESFSASVKYLKASDRSEYTPTEYSGYVLIAVGSYKMAVDESTAQVVGGNADVGNYEITYGEGNLTVIERSIEVITNTKDGITYNGEQHSDAGYTTVFFGDSRYAGLILETDVLTCTSKTEVINAGEHDNVCAYEAPANYTIASVTYGKIIISERDVQITTGSATFTYNGEPHSYTDDDVADNLVSGHTLQIDALFSRTDATGIRGSNAGVDNANTYKIFNGATDVTSNYNISYNAGKIKVDRREITITTATDTLTYNGADQSLTADTEITSGSLVTGDRLDIDGTPATVRGVTGASGVENVIGYKVLNLSDADVTSNYDISYVNGRIYVQAATLNIALNKNLTIAYGDSAESALIQNAVSGAVGGEDIVLSITYDRTLSGVGTYTATATIQAVKDSFGIVIENGANNYQLSATSETEVDFEVTQREITIRLTDVTKDYDASEYDITADATHYVLSNVVGGDSVDVVIKYNGSTAKPKNNGAYTVTVDTTASDFGANYTLNQSASTLSCTLKIEKVALTIVMPDKEIEYAAGALYPTLADGSYGYTSVTGLVGGETIKVTSLTYDRTPNAAGTYTATVSGIEVYSGGALIENNYKDYGATCSFVINGIRIIVTRNNLTKVYDGSPLAASSYANVEDTFTYTVDVAGGALRSGERFIISKDCSTEIANVKSVTNTTEYKVVDSSYNVVPDYVVVYEDNAATISITARPITVIVYGGTWEYDGTAHGNTSYDTHLYGDDTKPGLLSGDVLTVNAADSIISVGSRDNGTTFSSGKNYEIKSYDRSEISITHRLITVVTATNEWVYDGNQHSDVTYTTHYFGDSTKLGLISGTLTVDTEYNVTDVGEYDNATTFTPDGNHIIASYEKGTLKIKARKITITAENKSCYYGDDMPELTYNQTGTLPSATLTVTLSVPEGIGSWGKKTIAVSYTITGDADNYEIVTRDGELTVNKRPIIIITNSYTGSYDGLSHFDKGFNAYYYFAGSAVTDGSKEALVNGNTARVTTVTAPSVKNVGEVENRLAFAIDGGENYQITYEYGKLTVTPAALTVDICSSGQTNFAYGDDYDSVLKEVTATGLVNGETISVVLGYKNKNNKEITPIVPVNYAYTAYLKVAECTVYDSYNAVISGGIRNYNVSCAVYQFSIVKREIIINLGAWASEAYTGAKHTFNKYNFALDASSSMAYTDTLSEVEVKYFTDAALTSPVANVINAGTYYVTVNEVTTAILQTSTGTSLSLSKYYTVVCDPVEFVVTPAMITVALTDAQSEYDGTDYEYPKDKITVTGLIGDDDIAPAVIYKVGGTEVESAKNAANYTVHFDYEDGISMTVGIGSNYAVNVAASTLTCNLIISPRTISVSVKERIVELGGTVAYDIDGFTATGAGIISGDLEQDTDFYYKYNGSTTVPTDYGEYTVEIVFNDTEAMHNYTVENNKSNKLHYAERCVSVSSIRNNYVYAYSGEQVTNADLNIKHVHYEDETNYGFESLAGITVTYTIKESKGSPFTVTVTYGADGSEASRTGDMPTNSGRYDVEITLSGYDTSKYYVPEIEKARLTINTLVVKLEIEITDGDQEVDYTNTKPYFTAQITSIKNGSGVEYTAEEKAHLMSVMGADPFALMTDGYETVENFDAGTYYVGVDFATKSNYSLQINMDARNIMVIKKLMLVIMPTDPYGGVAQVYNGESLKLGETDFTYYTGVDGASAAPAAGDVVTISSTELAPTELSGKLSITGVAIKDATDRDVACNYDLVYAKIPGISLPAGLRSEDFKVEVSFMQLTVNYMLNVSGGTYDYTGSKITVEYRDVAGTLFVTVGDMITVQSITKPDGTIYNGSTLYTGHRLTLTATSFTIGSAAGVYNNWFKTLAVVNEDGVNYSKLYSFVCTNADETAAVISYREVQISLSSATSSYLDANAGSFATDSKGYAILPTGAYSVTFRGSAVGQGDASAYLLDDALEHYVRVYVFKTKGSGTYNWQLKAVIFKYSSLGKITDAGDSYVVSGMTAAYGVSAEFTSYGNLASVISDMDIDISYAFDASGNLIASHVEQVSVERGGSTVTLNKITYPADGDLHVDVFVEDGAVAGTYNLSVVIYTAVTKLSGKVTITDMYGAYYLNLNAGAATVNTNWLTYGAVYGA